MCLGNWVARPTIDFARGSKRVVGPIEKREPVPIVRGEPPEGCSVLRILRLRISKTVSFAVSFLVFARFRLAVVSIGQQVGQFVGEGRWWPAGVDVGRGGSFHRLSFQRLPERPG